MINVHTRFQTKTAQKPYPLERQILTYMADIGEYPPWIDCRQLVLITS